MNPYRKRYTIDGEGNFVEKFPQQQQSSGLTIISDIAPFQTQDGVSITSRRSLREYEQRTGTRQSGNDWTGSSKPAFWDAMIRNQKQGRQ